jgi:hypothetical protein
MQAVERQLSRLGQVPCSQLQKAPLLRLRCWIQASRLSRLGGLSHQTEQHTWMQN